MTIDLSVIMPAFNEENNLSQDELEVVYNYLKSKGYKFELILANDGSTDNTLSILKRFSRGKTEVKVLDLPHRGKGPTVATGMMTAKGEYRLYTDSDQSTPIAEVEKLLPFTKKGYDVVIGSREVQGSKRENEPWHRHLMGKGFNLVVKIFSIRGIQDTQCGFKMFSKKATETLFPKLQATNKPKKDAFTGANDVELLYLAQKEGYRIAEVPVIWHHKHSVRVSPIKDSLRMFGEVLNIRLTAMMGKYD